MTDGVHDWRSLIERPEWMDRAACIGAPFEVFFPTRGADVDAAKVICRCCQVRSECLAYALNTGEKYGIWGGTSERQRRRLRKQLNLSEAPAPPISRDVDGCGTTAGYRRHRYRCEEPCTACKDAYARDKEFSRPSRAGIER